MNAQNDNIPSDDYVGSLPPKRLRKRKVLYSLSPEMDDLTNRYWLRTWRESRPGLNSILAQSAIAIILALIQPLRATLLSLLRPPKEYEIDQARKAWKPNSKRWDLSQFSLECNNSLEDIAVTTEKIWEESKHVVAYSISRFKNAIIGTALVYGGIESPCLTKLQLIACREDGKTTIRLASFRRYLMADVKMNLDTCTGALLSELVNAYRNQMGASVGEDVTRLLSRFDNAWSRRRAEKLLKRGRTENGNIPYIVGFIAGLTVILLFILVLLSTYFIFRR
jgi:hypothetical protein